MGMKPIPHPIHPGLARFQNARGEENAADSAKLQAIVTGESDMNLAAVLKRDASRPLDMQDMNRHRVTSAHTSTSALSSRT